MMGTTTRTVGTYLYTLAVAAAWAVILTLLLRGTALAAGTDTSPFGTITSGINTTITELKPLLIAGGTVAVLIAGAAWIFSDRHMKKFLVSGLGAVLIGILGQPFLSWLQTTFGGTASGG